MSLLIVILLVAALVCFLLATLGRVHSRVDLVSLGLFLTVLSMLIKVVTSA